MNHKEDDMKNAKKVMGLAVLGMAVCASSAWAVEWTSQDKGAVYPGADTKVVTKHEFNMTSHDVFWQGKSENLAFRCPPKQAEAFCEKLIKVTGAKSTSLSKHWHVVGPRINDAELASTYKRLVASKTQSTPEAGLSVTVKLKRGQSAQPVAVQDRRMMKGVFNGGYFKTGMRVVTTTTPPGKKREYSYDWAQKDFGAWFDHRAVGAPYYKVVVKNGTF